MNTPSPRMKLGIQPTGWTNDDFPEIGDDVPYQTILDETVQAGFEGGSTGHNYPTHLPSLLHALKSRNLQITGTWAGLTFTTGVDADAAFADFQAQVSFLTAVGAHDVVVAELAGAVNQIRTKAVLTDRPIFSGPQWYLLTTLLDKAGECAFKQGMRLSYHPHVGTGVMTIEESVRLMEHTDPDYVGLCIDTAHLRYGGASQSEIVDFAGKYAKRIKQVHLKNVRGDVLKRATDEKSSFYEAIQHGIFTVPGDPKGEMDSCLVRILQILQKAQFDRWLVIESEQNPANANPVEYAKMARNFLRENLGW